MCNATSGCTFSFPPVLFKLPKAIHSPFYTATSIGQHRFLCSPLINQTGELIWLKNNRGKRIIVFQLDLLPHICANSCMSTIEWVGQEREQLAEVELFKPTLLLLKKCIWNHSLNVLF